MDQRQRHAQRAEYDTGFGKASGELRLRLNSAIETRSLQALESLRQSVAAVPDLQPLLEGDVGLLKLYIATIVYSSVETAKRCGLPEDIAENHKHICLVGLTGCQTAAELGQVHFAMIEQLVLGLQRYSMQSYSPLVRRAVEFIHNSKFTFLFAGDVAKAVHADRSYLAKRFRQEVGQTMTEYIRRTKMDLAVELIEANLYSTNEIAEMLGYADTAYFSRVFKKTMGVAPGEYRRRGGGT